jgi:hypothetical protein
MGINGEICIIIYFLKVLVPCAIEMQWVLVGWLERYHYILSENKWSICLDKFPPNFHPISTVKKGGSFPLCSNLI